ncbi:MAG: PEP-CTERM system histidine kinase PrsK [Roseococcus sp.]|nr:PEP-CTERM system histidine kinase PrsK [Roseococcus sp.]
MSPESTGWFHAGAAVLCLAWAALTLVLGRGRHALLFTACLLAMAAWAAAVALGPAEPLGGAGGVFEVLRSVSWLILLLVLCHWLGARSWVAGLGTIGALLALAALWPALARSLPLLGSLAFLPRLALALLVVLTAENLYRNASEAARWHVVLPCIALGGLAAFDMLIHADAALSRAYSPALLDARAALTAVAAPLLVMAALRDRRARREPSVSRQFVFHGATLMVAGTFLLAIGALSEALRQWGVAWAAAALVAAALMALAVALSAASLRGRLRRLLARHFFRARHDYRHEWLRCLATLSQPEAEASAEIRAIRALADPADSPSGVLLLRDPVTRAWRWGGGWNAIAAEPDAALRAELDAALREGECHANTPPGELPAMRRAYGAIHLVIPLLHHRDGLIGAVLLAPPRAPFALGRDALALLQMLGREVAMFMAERRAVEHLAEQEQLQDYARRFTFVAHDVKNVGAQLTMLLGNADVHIGNPEFQQDMLLTIRASAERIRTLIARLDQGETPPERQETDPLPRLQALAQGLGRPVELLHDGSADSRVAMPPEQFDSAVRHLLDNAVQAAPEDRPLRLRLRREAACSIVEITDQGPGMSPEFVRDALFRPLVTSRPDGSGIGAWQARELLRGCGGDLDVESRPGHGTTMRLRLPHAAGQAR